MTEKIDYKKYKVLVVDDELDNLESFKMEFGEDFNILTASNAREALAILDSVGEVALIISDQRMPDMTGIELLREIVNQYPDTIRFLITAYSDIDVVINAINSGNVYRYISKPWAHEDVRVSMMRALESYFLTKDRERLIEEKVESARRAAEANRLASLGMLSASIAHEINNPMVSINTFVKLFPSKVKELKLSALAGYDKGYWEDFHKLAEDEVRRVQELVRELLNLAKPPKYDFEETPIELLITAENKIFETAAREKDIRFKTMIPQNLPPIRCDKNRIKQLLLNLVINAIQATSRGGQVWIEAQIPPKKKNSGNVEIRVCDTGEGMPDEVKKKIFEPFFSTKKKGTGLGLMVCDFIVKHHGGEISVESQVGKGTTFIISLPLNPQVIGQH